jgi:cob(I)alamin adenosyltransferase
MTAQMSIVTKTGDKGKTGLYAGKRVSKDNLRVEIFGNLDELCSFMGLAKSLVKDARTKTLLEDIQRDLFVVGAEVATEAKYLGKLKHRIGHDYIAKLEKHIYSLESRANFEGCCFYLPGGNPPAAALDVARTITRRVERRLVTLKRRGMLKNADMLIYVNRLSDLLFVLSRRLEKRPKRVSAGRA